MSTHFVGATDAKLQGAVQIVGMTNLHAIGRRVKQLRKQRGLSSQDDLAAEIGVSRSAIAGIEAGSDRGGLETMVAIADYFKVPLDWLLCRKPPPGGPLAGQFVDDPDELAWLDFWRDLDRDDKVAVTRLLRVPGFDRAAK